LQRRRAAVQVRLLGQTKARPSPEPECDAVEPREKPLEHHFPVRLRAAPLPLSSMAISTPAPRADRGQLNAGGAAVFDGIGDCVVHSEA